ncbi:MAG: Qat anti-phage system QueC-like protein QatC [Thermodesulfobacteriota bacterium]
MKRHVMIGRFGLTDRAPIPIAADEMATRLELITSGNQLGYGIGHALVDLTRLGVFPTELGLDLLILAAHVHASDTRISRKTESQDSWTREIRLVVPVSDPLLWSASAQMIARLLNFLTGDRWVIGFRARPRGFKTIVARKPRRLVAAPFNSLSLFSGGLDSLIGAIDLLENGKEPLLVSHAGEGAGSQSQANLYDSLKKYYRGRSFNRLRLFMSFPKKLVRGVTREETTRGRSFLFFALGIFAGSGLEGTFTLRVPENGFIALNVPLDPLRLGALSTRTSHPFYIARWNELLRVLGIIGRVENPYWDKTKGEMVAGCANSALLGRLIPASMSCSSPTKGRWQGRGIEHCGYCVPCLIRRASLYAGLGGVPDPTPYSMDLGAHVLDTRRAEGQEVRSFQFAIERLRAKPSLARILIHKAGPLSDESPIHQKMLAEVYRRGLAEVAALVAGVRTRPS